ALLLRLLFNSASPVVADRGMSPPMIRKVAHLLHTKQGQLGYNPLPLLILLVIFLLSGGSVSCNHLQYDFDGGSIATSSLNSSLSLLLEVKASFVEDPYGVLDGWSSSDTPVYCTWTGITCAVVGDEGSVVVGLNLSSFSLAGSISPPIALLSGLVLLDLSGNR